MKKMKKIGLCAMVAGTMAHSVDAMASGYALQTQSISALGYANANTAQADDASTAYFNPAGMTRLRGTNISGSLSFLAPDMRYTDTGSTHFTGTSVSGTANTGSFTPQTYTTPSFFLTHQVNDRLQLGIGVFSPYAAKLDYGTNWVGRYGMESFNLESYDVNPVLAFKINEQHSIGVGLTAEYMKLTMTKAYDMPGYISSLSSAQAIAIASQITAAGGNASLLSSAKDGQQRISGADWGYGANLGYLFQPNKSTRFGATWRSAIHHTLTGDSTWDFSGITADSLTNSLLQSLSGKANGKISMPLDSPETISVNGYHDINDTWSVMADLTWTHYSALRDITITYVDTSIGQSTVQQKWKNTLRASVGAGYRYSQNLLLKAGLAVDQSPLASSGQSSAAIPTGGRTWLSLGANYKTSAQSSVDVAYTYVMYNDTSIASKNSCTPASVTCTGNGETTSGTYRASAQMLGVQYNYAF